MPNFEARVRTNYTDIDGLVLDCRHADLADDGSLWVNRAPPARALFRGSHDGADNALNLFDSGLSLRANQLVGMVAYNITDGSMGFVTSNSDHEVVASLSGGTDNNWDAGDLYVITTPRFGNPYQDEAARRPVVSTVGGFKQAVFTRTNQSRFKIPLAYSFPASCWTIAFEYFKGANNDNQQVLLGFPYTTLGIYRRSSGGTRGYWYTSGGSYNGTDLPDGTWLFGCHSDTTFYVYQNGVEDWNGSFALTSIAAGDPCGYIGDDINGAKACDMILRSMQIWNRKVSPLEVDFAYQSLSPEFDYAVQNRSTNEKKIWTDNTTPVSRINPTRIASHKFVLATIPADGERYRVQIVAMVNGKVLPDSELGGDLFQLVEVEYPLTIPVVRQDTGWSSVFDVEVQYEGHYTYNLVRKNGGSVVVHFDIERAS